MRCRNLRYLAPAVLGLLAASPAPGSCQGAEQELATARAALAQGRVEAAASRLAALADTHPACAQAELLRAQIQAGRGRAGEAEESFLRACELAPSEFEPIFQLGVFYDGQQQHGRAADAFREALGLAPGDPQAYDYLGLSLEALGQFDQAEAAFRMGLARNRGPRFDPMLHYNYGRFLMKHNRLEEARGHLDQALELVSGVRAVRYERAKLAERLGDLPGARLHAEQALALQDPGQVILDMQVYYLLARVYRALGETELAEKFTQLSQASKVPMSARRRLGR